MPYRDAADQMRNYARWAAVNRPSYLTREEYEKRAADRRREIAEYVSLFPSVTATEVAMAFEVSDGTVRQALKRAGFRLEWVRK